MPLHELIESHRILLDSADDWSEDWFPFAANGGGDHLFADGDGRVREYWHADKDRSVINENLAAWVDDVIAEVGRSQCQSGLEAWDKVDLYLEKAPDGGNQALLKLKKELKLQMGISKLAHLSKNAPVLLMEGIYFVHAKRYCKVLPCLGVRKTGKVEDR